MVKTFSYQLVKHTRKKLVKQFPEEADTMAFQVVEHFSGLSRTDILLDKPFSSGPQLDAHIERIIDRLLANEPLQYILGVAYFYNHLFEVNSFTLIPRQETEELVQLVLNDVKNETQLSIIDIGTGSGCIPISIQLESGLHKIEGIDISKHALETAKSNALKLGASVEFNLLDILERDLPTTYDVIISNPPYVLESEKALMKPNVLEHEPATALFVPNANPLLFYKRITEQAAQHLTANGKLYFEINEQFGKEVVALLALYSFSNIILHQDLNGKDRFVTGIKL